VVAPPTLAASAQRRLSGVGTRLLVARGLPEFSPKLPLVCLDGRRSTRRPRLASATVAADAPGVPRPTGIPLLDDLTTVGGLPCGRLTVLAGERSGRPAGSPFSRRWRPGRADRWRWPASTSPARSIPASSPTSAPISTPAHVVRPPGQALATGLAMGRNAFAPPSLAPAVGNDRDLGEVLVDVQPDAPHGNPPNRTPSGQHDTYGFALVAQPGWSQGRPDIRSDSRSIFATACPFLVSPSAPSRWHEPTVPGVGRWPPFHT
jgi:hypothetical protein